jgi:hypothetical protein
MMQVRQVVHAIHRAERILLDEIALDESLGATSESWPMVAHAIRTAAFEILAAYAERDGGRTALRDSLTTLISPHVFRLALEQNRPRPLRTRHVRALRRRQPRRSEPVELRRGPAARTARHPGAAVLPQPRLGGASRRDGIAALLPETALNQASVLASRFREWSAAAGAGRHRTRPCA